MKEIRAVVGSLGVVGRDEAAECLRLGYCLGRAFWYRGLVAEALAEAVRFLFEEVGARRLEAIHDPGNPNSGRVLRKCGFVYEGVIRRGGRNNQGVYDALGYGLANPRLTSQ